MQKNPCHIRKQKNPSKTLHQEEVQVWPFCSLPKHQSSESVKKWRTCLTGPACRSSWGWWFPPAPPQHLVLFSSSRGATLPAACPQNKLVGHTEGVSAELWNPFNISQCLSFSPKESTSWEKVVSCGSGLLLFSSPFRPTMYTDSVEGRDSVLEYGENDLWCWLNLFLQL